MGSREILVQQSAAVLLWIAPSEFSLIPGDRKTFEIRSTFRNDNGQPIKLGEYTLEAFLLDSQSPSVSIQVKVQ